MAAKLITILKDEFNLALYSQPSGERGMKCKRCHQEVDKVWGKEQLCEGCIYDIQQENNSDNREVPIEDES